jgi:hypothetical protein
MEHIMNKLVRRTAMRLSIARSQTDDVRVTPRDWREILAEFPEEIRDAWEERAAIIEYDGREPRPTAERRAFECIVDQFESAAAILRARITPAKGARRRLA